MKKYLTFAVFSPILMVLEVVADIIIPYLMSRIVDVGIVNRDIDYIVEIGLIMVSAALAAMIFGIISAHFSSRAGLGFASEIRQQAFKKVQDFSFANLD